MQRPDEENHRSQSSSCSFRDTVISDSSSVKRGSHAGSIVSNLSRGSDDSEKSWTSSESGKSAGPATPAVSIPCQGKFSAGDLVYRASILRSLLPGGNATLQVGHCVEFPAPDGSLLRATATGIATRPFVIRSAHGCTGIASTAVGPNSSRSGRSCMECHNAWLSMKKAKV